MRPFVKSAQEQRDATKRNIVIARKRGAHAARFGGGGVSRFRRPPRRLWVLLVGLGLLAAACGPLIPPAPAPVPPVSSADPAGQVTTYPAPALSVTAGPDGNLWFACSYAIAEACVGKMTPTGTVSLYSLGPTQVGVDPVAAGPDGDIWFIESLPSASPGGPSSSYVVRMNTSGDILTRFPLPDGQVPSGPYYYGKLMAGPDGDMWFATADAQNLDQWSIDKISETGLISSYPLPVPAIQEVQDLAVGPDGDIWFTDPANNTIGKIETSGNGLTDYHYLLTPTGPLPEPGWITPGPDGRMWFTSDYNSAGGQLSTITTSGIYQPLSLSSPASVDEPVLGADGNVWVTAPFVAGDYIGKYAQVVRITSSGEVTQYPLPANSVHNIGDAIAAGPDGDIWVAGVYSIYKVGTSAAPGGPPPPALSQPVARQSDPLLMRQLPVQATAATTSVEYGWAAAASAGAPDLALSGQAAYQTCTDLQACWLDYRAAQPDQTWYLFARSVDASGDWGPWSAALAVKTPGKPLVIALGDSMTSGHHKDSNTSLTVCDDPAYSYAAGVFANTNSFLPTTWQRSSYTNLAHSGFSTGQIIGGGRNACGTNVPSSPLTAAEKLLRTNAGSWNRLVMSADVDDTNWNSVIARIILNDRLPGRYSASSCRQDMAEWDGTNRSVIAGIKRSDLQIVNGLEAMDPTVTIDWLDYYQIAGTGTDKVSTRPVMPAVCTQAVQTALTYLNVDDIQQATQGKGVVLVNTNALIGGQDDYLQGFYPSDYVAIHKLPGWPHPNEEGQAKIAAAIGP